MGVQHNVVLSYSAWYVFLFSLTVPMAASYVIICLVLSVLERIEK